jgi:hypothetical protein
MNETIVTVDMSMRGTAQYPVKFWSRHDGPADQLRTVLEGWTRLTGLNWSAMPNDGIDDADGRRYVRVKNPLDNRGDATFSWSIAGE